MQLAKYDAMINAIALCESVDEVKDIRDKAIALEVYAKQAKNFDAERRCATVRVRAERQCGILLKSTEKAKGSRGKIQEHTGGTILGPPVDAPKTLDDMGISKKESSSFQKLADIDEDVFEERIQAALEGDISKPTARKIINKDKPDIVATPPKAPKEVKTTVGKILSAIQDLSNCDVSGESLYRSSTDKQKALLLQEIRRAYSFINQLSKVISHEND